MKTIQEEKELFAKDPVLYQYYTTAEGYRFFLDHKEEINNVIVRKLIVSKANDFIRLESNSETPVYSIYEQALNWLKNDAPGKTKTVDQERDLVATGDDDFLNYANTELARFLFHKKLRNEQVITELLRKVADFAQSAPDKEFESYSLYEQLELFYSKMYN